MESTLASSDYTTAAARLKGVVSEAPDPHLMLLCAETLDEMGGNLFRYTKGLEVTAPFFKELCDTIRSVCQDEENHAGVMHDKAFSLMECLAVIVCESTMNQTSGTLLPAQTLVLKYFEDCGHWFQGDGTMVCDTYYYLKSKASTEH